MQCSDRESREAEAAGPGIISLEAPLPLAVERRPAHLRLGLQRQSRSAGRGSYAHIAELLLVQGHAASGSFAADGAQVQVAALNADIDRGLAVETGFRAGFEPMQFRDAR